MSVVLLTGHSDREALHRARLAGRFEIVLKPFDQHGLCVHLERALGRGPEGE